MEKEKKNYPSYLGEFYGANPTKFENRKNHIKPKIYLVLAIVCVILVIFPGWVPVAAWLVRTVGVIAALVCLIASYMSSSDTYNIQSGGIIKSLGTKKFNRNETNPERILSAFLSKDFEFLAELPGEQSAPVQLHIDEDKEGNEMYCLLTTYDSNSTIIGLANVITLSGNEYIDNIDLIKQMFKDYNNNK